MKLSATLLTLAAFVAGSAAMQAETVTVTLGQSTNNFELDGLGDNGFGYATYVVQLGPCSGGVCTLTGAYTSSDLYGSGTYSMVTDYPGTSVPTGISYGDGNSGYQNEYEYLYIAPGTAIYLDLAENGGPTFDVPIYQNGNWVNGDGYGISYTSYDCTGVPANECEQYIVGETPGASIFGPVEGSATITSSLVTTATPEPATLGLLGTGLVGLAGFVRRRRSA